MAQPHTVSARWSGWKPYENHYLSTYVDCWHHFKAECGRNIVDDDLVTGVEPSKARVKVSTDRMRTWLRPPAPVYTPTTSSYAAPTYSAPGGSVGGCVGMEAESGTAGYDAYNPSSGAQGCYQVIPSTHDAVCSDLGWSPGEQDECAARICAAQGSGAWSSSGANPC